MKELGRKFYEVMDQLDLTKLSATDRAEIEAIRFEVDQKQVQKALHVASQAVGKSS